MTKIQTSKVIQAYFFITLLMASSIFIFKSIAHEKTTEIVIITFIVNGIIIIYELIKSSKLGYSLKDTFYIFMFIFMFVSPLIQYINNNFPWWDNYLITDTIVIYANLTILLFLIVYGIVYRISFNKTSFNKRDIYKNNIIKGSTIELFFILTIISSIYIIYITGFRNLFSRSINILQIESSSLKLIVSRTLRSIPVWYVTMNILYYRQNKIIYKKIPLIIGILLMFLINFPTGTARYWTASIYLGFILLYFSKFKNSYMLKIIIIFGLFTIFPFLDLFRNNTIQEVFQHGFKMIKPSELLMTPLIRIQCSQEQLFT